MSLTFRVNHWMSSMRFHKVSTSSASITGRNAGPLTWNQNRPALKGIRMTNNEGRCIFCYQCHHGTSRYAL
jgi:hypothetical protein